ncbi:hypothetical protein A3Q56_06181, partial [Intoshia linei]
MIKDGVVHIGHYKPYFLGTILMVTPMSLHRIIKKFNRR